MSPSLGTRDDAYLKSGQFEVTFSYRFLKSENVFIGTEEQSEIKAAAAEPRHTRHSIDLSARYGFSQRFSATLTVPFIRPTTSFPLDDGIRQSFGLGLVLGDIRVQGGLWLFDPVTHVNGNLAVSAGIKMPTGNEASTMTLRTPGGPLTVASDIADQPGDGGWGVILEGRWFRKVSKSLIVHASGFYLINPRNTNDVEPPQSIFDPNNQFFVSVPDQYNIRAGLSFPIWSARGIYLSMGGRIDGVPVEDLLGDSDGFRRPGYSIYLEPALAWSSAKNSFNLSIPIAAKRNMKTSLLDASRGEQTWGGLAGFLIVTSFSRLF